mmetsp:Transcript_31694/g.104881  ORF Transcript_31694/g.104881 Transcript_31694/m.104881 type:complete len:347 (+) Transcript_31694:1692-2732(+)
MGHVARRPAAGSPLPAWGHAAAFAARGRRHRGPVVRSPGAAAPVAPRSGRRLAARRGAAGASAIPAGRAGGRPLSDVAPAIAARAASAAVRHGRRLPREGAGDGAARPLAQPRVRRGRRRRSRIVRAPKRDGVHLPRLLWRGVPQLGRLLRVQRAALRRRIGSRVGVRDPASPSSADGATVARPRGRSSARQGERGHLSFARDRISWGNRGGDRHHAAPPSLEVHGGGRFPSVDCQQFRCGHVPTRRAALLHLRDVPLPPLGPGQPRPHPPLPEGHQGVHRAADRGACCPQADDAALGERQLRGRWRQRARHQSLPGGRIRVHLSPHRVPPPPPLPGAEGGVGHAT